jgi:hypothetical protein
VLAAGEEKDDDVYVDDYVDGASERGAAGAIDGCLRRSTGKAELVGLLAFRGARRLPGTFRDRVSYCR